MSNPQPDKYTKFSNELLEAYLKVAKYLTTSENTVWLCIVRLTYGYGKKIDQISLSQIGEMTNILQCHVARTIKQLLLKNMVLHFGEKGRTYSTGIQKNYDEWNLLPSQVVGENTTTTKEGHKLLPRQVVDLLPSQVVGENPPNNPYNVVKEINKEIKIGATSPKTKRFVPPTASEVESYAKSIGFELNGEKFVAHYGAGNWMRGKTKITNWKLCVQTWKHNEPKKKETVYDNFV